MDTKRFGNILGKHYAIYTLNAIVSNRLFTNPYIDGRKERLASFNIWAVGFGLQPFFFNPQLSSPRSSPRGHVYLFALLSLVARVSCGLGDVAWSPHQPTCIAHDAKLDKLRRSSNDKKIDMTLFLST